jgi:hypothetical protein
VAGLKFQVIELPEGWQGAQNVLQRFACARLSQPCLSESCSDFSATFTTIAFDNNSLRRLEINT